MRRKIFGAREYKVKIGDNIRKWRNLKGIKQKELASALELSEAAISNIENNITDVTLSQLEDISLGLDIPVEHLFCDPQESFTVLPPKNGHAGLPGKAVIESELLNAVISSMQKKDEQMQSIMQNVLNTMNSLVKDEKPGRSFAAGK